jgi:hypothetical protein
LSLAEKIRPTLSLLRFNKLLESDKTERIERIKSSRRVRELLTRKTVLLIHTSSRLKNAYTNRKSMFASGTTTIFYS